MTPRAAAARRGLRALVSVAALAALAALAGVSSEAAPVELARRLAWGEERLRAEDLAAARAVAEETFAALGEHGDAVLRARAGLLAGSVLGEQGERKRAERGLAHALEGARAAGDRTLEGRVRLAQGMAAWRRADYPAADVEAAAALAAAGESGAAREESDALWLLAASRFKRGDYAAADRLFEQALAAGERAAAPDCAGRAEEGLGMSALDRRDYRRAESRLARAVAAFERAGAAPAASRALAEIAVLHLFEGRPEEALPWAERALERAVAAGERPAEARARQVLGNTERERGRPAEAAAQLARAAELRAATGNRREEAWARAGSARVLAEGGEPAQARARLDPALAVWRQLEDRRALAWHLLERARLDLDLGESETAVRALDEATRLALAIELPYTSEILRTWSRLEAGHGARAEARRRADEAVAAARRSGNDEMLWRALVTEASAAAAAGDAPAATAAIAEALPLVERLRDEALPGDEGSIAAIEERLDGFEEAIGVLFDLGRGEAALLLAERARGRALLDRLGAQPVASRAAIAAVARTRGVDLYEVFVGERRSFAWLVTRDGRIRAHELPASRARLERLVARATEAGAGGAAARRAAGRELAAILLAPFAAALEGSGAPLAVAAHGPLLRLPFAALPDRARRPLVARRALLAIPSIGFLARPPASARGTGCLLLADPEPPPLPGRDRPLPRLPGARRETAAIAALLAGEAPVRLVGAAASEERLRALAPGARLVHIAAHGLPDDERPLAGRLALAASAGDPPAAERDGLWSARDALALGLDADLVVLSACSGARGRLSGEGTLGFGYALLGAGARAVVASLWRVPDEVAAFQLERFYRELAAPAATAAEALRRAQLATRRELAAGRFRDAAGGALADEALFWAPFVLLGRPDAGLARAPFVAR